MPVLLKDGCYSLLYKRNILVEKRTNIIGATHVRVVGQNRWLLMLSGLAIDFIVGNASLKHVSRVADRQATWKREKTRLEITVVTSSRLPSRGSYNCDY
ncbi:MAG: hypothetical protein KDB03_11565 [Planctomycetales bacterium]|nr:hypothetical protein [Planctomycetales bacterium]